MFYFDEDHTENGFYEPFGVDNCTISPRGTMDSLFDKTLSKNVSTDEWRRSIGNAETQQHQKRFILGNDDDEEEESDLGEEEFEQFGSSPDSGVEKLGNGLLKQQQSEEQQQERKRCRRVAGGFNISPLAVTADETEQEEEEGYEEAKNRHAARLDFEMLRRKLSESSLGFGLDEDSGIGASAPNSINGTDDENGEREEHPSELVPILSASRPGFNLRKGRSKLVFQDFYHMVDDHLGSGAYACVSTAVSRVNGKEYAVKLVDKHEHGHTRSRIIREVEIFKMCRNHPNIVQLIEWFENDDYFYMVFEKMRGGPLLNHIQRKVCFTEEEASQVTKDIAGALKYLHDRGVAHRDVKPENILCTEPDRVSPVKLCDLDLASKPSAHHNQRVNAASFSVKGTQGGINIIAGSGKKCRMPTVVSEPDLASPVGSAEFMAPEVVDAFVNDSLKYDKRCDMWSLGVIVYIMLCGYPPFYGECERENCGWDQGESCSDCQDNLFQRIQYGQFSFPEEEWADISDEAKHLITHLLVRDVRQRFTADDVLKHTWVAHGAPKTLLSTPSNLFRNDSTRDVHQMSELFKAYPAHEFLP